MPFTGSAGNKNFTRTNGFYSGPTTWQQTEAGGRDILSLDEDVHDQDIAAAIDNSLQKDGSNHPIGDIPMSSYKFTGLSYGLNYGDSVALEQLVQSTPFAMSGGILMATAASNILTVSIRGLDGNPPTPTKPVILNFHSLTGSNGLPVILKVTSALSMTVSAGSTLGVPANAPFKVRVAVFNDGTGDAGGTPRLAVMYGAITGTYDQAANATAEGGAGAADSAGLWYSSAAVASKMFRVIGTLTWAPPGMAVPGNWTNPTYVTTQAQDEALPFTDNVMPVGVVMPFAGATPPSGWALCQGQAVSRTTYARLFSVIGTTFGIGDGSTTFNIPDMQGRVAAGPDPTGTRLYNGLLTGGMNGNILGSVGGLQYHVLTDVQEAVHQHFMDHNHVPRDGGNFRTDVLGATAVAAPIAGATNGLDNITSGSSITYTNGNAGGNAHNNVQPTLMLNQIIYTGV